MLPRPVGGGKTQVDAVKLPLLSGTAFGRYGQGYVRLSYATSAENLRKAAARLRDFVGKLARAGS